jgi:protein-S-isoprenylcysteine O-methyltransferase Ste14
MNTFDRIRYAMALVILVAGPGAVLFWFPIHPFARFWRRVGARWAYTVGVGVYAVSAAILTTHRRTLLSIEFGTSAVTIALGLAFIAAHTWLRRRWRQHLTLGTLLGLPELAPESHPRVLLTEGVYARIRHPRYLEILLGYAGFALVSNYLAAYGVTAFLVLAILALIPIEERELVDQFGEAYEEYRRRVPALIPRPGKAREAGR